MTGILLIEDDDRLSALVRDYLTCHGYEVAIERDGGRAGEAVRRLNPALVLLDVCLPGKDGLEVCRDIRAHYRGIVLMLTARVDDVDQVLGLELGADDYLAKPVQPRVLLARIRAHLRRSAAESGGRPLCFGQLKIDRVSREVSNGGRSIELTTAEFDLLWRLAEKAGDVLSRDALLQALRGIEFDGLDRSIDARICRLRRKLGIDEEGQSYIKTVRGQGYLFCQRSRWQT